MSAPNERSSLLEAGKRQRDMKDVHSPEAELQAGPSYNHNQPFLAPLSPGLQDPNSPSQTGPTFSQALYPVYNDPFSPDAIRQADRRGRKRFALSLILGFLAWMLLGLLIGLIGGEGAGWLGDRPYRNRWPGALPGDPALDGNITSEGCTDFLKTLPTSAIVLDPNGLELPRPHLPFDPETSRTEEDRMTTQGSHDGPPYAFYRSRSFHHFQVDESDGFFLLGRGRYSAGPVKYVLEKPKSTNVSAPAVGKHTIEVEVVARWNDKELLKTAKVCPLVRKSTAIDSRSSASTSRYREYGIGIFTPEPDYPDQYRHLSFETIVRLPPSGLDKLRSLSLRGSSFSPVDLALSPVAFESVNLNTSNGRISISPDTSLKARRMDIHTSNGRIDGVYSVSDSLRLVSTNGPIQADINLVKPGYSETEDITVLAETTNGNVGLRYLQQPYGVTLDSIARTTNGDAKVSHQPAFEGEFSLQTSWGKASVDWSTRSRDPSGKNRKRHFELTQNDRGLGVAKKAGKISWLPEDQARLGKTVVETSLGGAALAFL